MAKDKKDVSNDVKHKASIKTEQKKKLFISSLQPGVIVKHKASGEAYVVTANYCINAPYPSCLPETPLCNDITIRSDSSGVISCNMYKSLNVEIDEYAEE
jgi:hypothetical protein